MYRIFLLHAQFEPFDAELKHHKFGDCTASFYSAKAFVSGGGDEI